MRSSVCCFHCFFGSSGTFWLVLTKNEVGSPIPRGSGPESDAKLVGIVSLSAHIQELCVTAIFSIKHLTYTALKMKIILSQGPYKTSIQLTLPGLQISTQQKVCGIQYVTLSSSLEAQIPRSQTNQ
ncbi:uncharacterized protein [Physcomitrium patens]|uniref:uncharacterized protein isoform X2 n=1 Tax=Physcomitrium patens TaxID=3218 RepID=UPI003CCD3A15